MATATTNLNAYCLKCRAHTEIVDAEEVKLKNGRAAAKGKCSVCGTRIFKFLGNAS